mmetsp:Transcript_1936/g.2884  ORF Transcript_1936/g.2884 Transcript_1936/m.2884 type:complete len:124 (-) Transcript_1936:351-722(-)
MFSRLCLFSLPSSCSSLSVFAKKCKMIGFNKYSSYGFDLLYYKISFPFFHYVFLDYEALFFFFISFFMYLSSSLPILLFSMSMFSFPSLILLNDLRCNICFFLYAASFHSGIEMAGFVRSTKI